MILTEGTVLPIPSRFADAGSVIAESSVIHTSAIAVNLVTVGTHPTIITHTSLIDASSIHTFLKTELWWR